MADAEQGDTTLATPTSDSATITQPAPAADAPKPDEQADALAALAKSITEGNIPEPKMPDAPASEAPKATATTTPSPASSTAQSTPVSGESSPDHKAALDDLPEVSHPYDLPDDPKLDGDVKERTRERFDAMRERLRSTREQAQFGQHIASIASKGGLAPEDFAGWVHLGVGINTGDKSAFKMLREKLREWDPDGETAPAPSGGQVDAIADQIVNEVFAESVRNLDLTPEQAKAMARKLAEKQVALLQAQKPAVASQQTHQVQQHVQHAPAVDPARDRVNALDAQFEASYKKTGRDYAPIRQKATEIIRAKMSKAPIDPQYWEYEWSQAVRQAISASTTQASPAAAQPAATQSLRPSTHLNASGRGAVLSPQDIAKAVTSGNFDLLNNL